jgi:uncharacterized protein YbcI
VVAVLSQSEQVTSPLTAIANAMVRLHKEQFGRGPTSARANFAGPDTLVCVLEDALLPAERKMAEMGDHQRVRESRMAFQVATADQFVAAVEQIVGREVRAFSSATDVTNNVIFENFVFQPRRTEDGSTPADARDADAAPAID